MILQDLQNSACILIENADIKDVWICNWSFVSRLVGL